MKQITRFLLSGLVASLLTTAYGADRKPNIVFVLADDLGWSDTATYASKYYETPNIDRLAQQGLKFTSFHACQNCQLTRASLMTGLYPHQAGVGDMNEEGANNEFWKRVGSPAYLGLKTRGIVTLPEVLRAAGYQTFMAGKWHLGKAPITAAWYFTTPWML